MGFNVWLLLISQLPNMIKSPPLSVAEPSLVLPLNFNAEAHAFSLQLQVGTPPQVLSYVLTGTQDLQYSMEQGCQTQQDCLEVFGRNTGYNKGASTSWQAGESKRTQISTVGAVIDGESIADKHCIIAEGGSQLCVEQGIEFFCAKNVAFTWGQIFERQMWLDGTIGLSFKSQFSKGSFFGALYSQKNFNSLTISQNSKLRALDQYLTPCPNISPPCPNISHPGPIPQTLPQYLTHTILINGGHLDYFRPI